MPALDSTVTITELRGESLSPGRSLELRGAGLPHQEAEWEVEQRVYDRWPAGSAEATQHVLGPREIPSDWTGMWRRTMLRSQPCVFFSDGGSATEVVDPAELRDIVELFLRAGLLLRVEWSADERSVVRVGRLTKAKFPHVRMTDIKWSVTFAWLGRGGQVVRPVSLRQDDSASELERVRLAVLAAANAVLARDRAFANSFADIASFTLADLESLLDLPLRLFASFEDAANFFARQAAAIEASLGRAAGKIVGTPAEVARRSLDLAASIVRDFNRASAEWTRIPGELVGDIDGGLANIANAVSFVQAVDTANQAAVEAALALVAKSRGQAGGEKTSGPWDPSEPDPAAVQGVVVARAGETFASIALGQYQDADRGGQLASANGFAPYQVAPDPGTTLIVPKLACLPEI